MRSSSKQVVGGVLLLKAVTGVANSMAGAALPQMLKNDLGFTEDLLGMYMSSQFAFGGISNGFLLGPMSKWLGGPQRAHQMAPTRSSSPKVFQIILYLLKSASKLAFGQ